jgi:hypothetical protein
MNFGKYAIIDNAEHKFEKEPGWYWRFHAATSADELAIAKLYSEKGTTVTGNDGKQYNIPPHVVEIMHREIALLFAGTNIPLDSEKPVGEPILKEDASVEDVERVLRQMPEEMVEEIWVALGKAIPFWGPPRKPEASTSEENSQPENETGETS